MDLLLAFLTFCVVNLSKASSNNLGSEDAEEGAVVGGGRTARVPPPPPPKDGGGPGIGGVIVDLWRVVLCLVPIVGTQKTIPHSAGQSRRSTARLPNSEIAFGLVWHTYVVVYSVQYCSYKRRS
jgi:hypothetical protein